MTYLHIHDGVMVPYEDVCPTCEMLSPEKAEELNGVDNPNIILGEG